MYQAKRILIRPLQESDVPVLLEFRLKNRAYLAPFEPILPEDHFTLDGQDALIQQAISNWDTDNGYAFAIVLRGEDQIVGRINLSNITRGAWENCTLGYYIDEDLQGNGYVTEAVQLGLNFAFDKIGLHRVEAGVMPCNRGSIRLLEKVGFHYIGLSRKHLRINGKWEDHRLYAITAEDWLSKGN